MLFLLNLTLCSLTDWGEQRGKAPLLTVDLAFVTVELNLRESGARFPCKWSSVLEIYINSYFPMIPYIFISSMRSLASLMEPKALLSAPFRFSPA